MDRPARLLRGEAQGVRRVARSDRRGEPSLRRSRQKPAHVLADVTHEPGLGRPEPGGRALQHAHSAPTRTCRSPVGKGTCNRPAAGSLRSRTGGASAARAVDECYGCDAAWRESVVAYAIAAAELAGGIAGP